MYYPRILRPLAAAFEAAKASCNSIANWRLQSSDGGRLSFSLDDGWGSISLNHDESGFVVMEWTEGTTQNSPADIKDIVQDVVSKCAASLYDRPTKDIAAAAKIVLKEAGWKLYLIFINLMNTPRLRLIMVMLNLNTFFWYKCIVLLR
jgi:hypothetical protein